MKTKKTAAIAARAKRAKRTSPTRARETAPRSDGKPGKPNDVSWHGEFLRIYEKTPSLRAACRAVKKSRTTVLEHREKFESFRAACDEAEQMCVEDMKALAVDHILNGVERPVYQGGKKVGTIREFDHRLLEWYLQRKRPSEFGDKKEIAVKELEPTLEDLTAKVKQSPALRDTLQKLLADAM